ncbi:MAG: hypothetical protein QXN26_06055 [Thermoplasmataceae archaeon]
MKRNLVIALAFVLAMLVPLITTAAVVVNNNVTVEVSPTHVNTVYLTEGPGYAKANASGYIGIAGNNAKYTNSTVYISTIPGSGYVVMTNVLAVYNGSASSSPLFLWINGTIPSGVQLFYSSSLMSFNGKSVSGTAMGSTNGPIHLTAPGDALYISIKVSSSSSAEFSLELQQE